MTQVVHSIFINQSCDDTSCSIYLYQSKLWGHMLFNLSLSIKVVMTQVAQSIFINQSCDDTCCSIYFYRIIVQDHSRKAFSEETILNVFFFQGMFCFLLTYDVYHFSFCSCLKGGHYFMVAISIKIEPNYLYKMDITYR